MFVDVVVVRRDDKKLLIYVNGRVVNERALEDIEWLTVVPEVMRVIT